MRNNYYTYAYMRKTGTPYYIGKGTGYRAFNKQGHRVAVPKDKKRIVFLKKDLTHDEAMKHERYMIAVLGRKDNKTGILHNRNDGGEGCAGMKRDDAFKKRMSEVHSGKTISPAHKRALREAHTGRTHTKEHNQKVSAALKGKPKPKRTMEHIEKLKGRKLSASHAEANGKAHAKPITLVHTITGEIRTFESGKEASSILNIHTSSVSSLRKGKLQTTSKWRLA